LIEHTQLVEVENFSLQTNILASKFDPLAYFRENIFS